MPKHHRKRSPQVYLSGGMEFSGDFGVGWRKDITPHLNSLGYLVHNPVIEQPKFSGYNTKAVKELRKNDFDKFLQVTKTIVDNDLASLKDSSLVVCVLDESVLKGAGTIGELTCSRQMGIPVISLLNIDKDKIPAWLFGCITFYTTRPRDLYNIIPAADRISVLKERVQREQADFFVDRWRNEGFTDY